MLHDMIQKNPASRYYDDEDRCRNCEHSRAYINSQGSRLTSCFGRPFDPKSVDPTPETPFVLLLAAKGLLNDALIYLKRHEHEDFPYSPVAIINRSYQALVDECDGRSRCSSKRANFFFPEE